MGIAYRLHGVESAPVFSKSEYAYAQIKQRILTDVLHPGDRLSQEGIAAELGISTTPVREGLKRLATEGFVVLETHRDARVTELSYAEARSLYDVRSQLDPVAARWAAERRTDADVTAVEQTLAALAPLSGTATLESLDAHRAFHRAVYAAAQNAPLVAILDGLWDKTDRYRQFTLAHRRATRTDVARVRREHRALAAAVVAGDGAAAEVVMREHVAGSLGRRAVEVLRPQDGPDPA